MLKKEVEPVELPRQPEVSRDAELTVPGSTIFSFLNHRPTSAPSRPVPISSETGPLVYFPFLTPGPGKAATHQPRSPCYLLLGRRPGSGLLWDPHHIRDKARDDCWTVDQELQAIHSPPMTLTKHQPGKGRTEVQGEGVTLFKGKAGALY